MDNLKVAAIQMGPYSGDYQSNLRNGMAALDRAVNEFQPDIVLFSELMTTPYFPVIYDDSWFEHAEPIPGELSEAIAEAAKRYGIHIIGTCFEKSGNAYYNSAFLVSPAGELKGIYRKVHVPRSGDRNFLAIDEQYYFQPGNEFPLFDVGGVPIGILICFDRSFPESFRVLMLKGAKVVFVPVATFGVRKEAFWEELRVRAMENHMFIVVANKAGDEMCEGEAEPRHHFGRSCIIDPMGFMQEKMEDEPFGILAGTLDLGLVDKWISVIDWRAHRKPGLYDIIASEQSP
jgi:N-carbamoylputrescine amidase